MGWIIEQIVDLAWTGISEIAYRKGRWGCWVAVIFGPIILLVAIVGLICFMA